MNFLESCSLYAGLKLKSPRIFEKIYPIPKNKYIVINTLSTTDGYKYPFWRDVMDSILKKLEELNIGIVLITDKDAYLSPKQVLNVNINKIKNSHLAYILRNSTLCTGTCFYSSALASHFNINSILISDKISPKYKRLYSIKNNVLTLTPQKKPGINHVTQELISNKIFENLNISFKLDIETIHQGSMYSDNQIFEVVPNQTFGHKNLDGLPINIRLDYSKKITNEDLSNTFEVLKTRKCTLTISEPFPVEPFYQLRQNIEVITYDITKKLDVNFLKNLSYLTRNIKLVFFTQENDQNEKELNKRKFDLIDFPYAVSVIDNAKEKINLTENNLYYKSSKFIFSKNKIFLSKSALDKGNSINDMNFYTEQDIKLIDTDNFKKDDIEFSYIFKKNN